MSYKARDFLNQSSEHILANMPDTFQLEYDDGQVFNSNVRFLAISVIFWKFHRAYPNLPLLYRHSISSAMKGKPFDSGTARKLMEVITKDLYVTYHIKHPKDMEPVQKLIFEVNNDVYNVGSAISEAYAVDIDILDFLDIVDYAPIKAELEAVEPNSESIESLYRFLDKTLKTDPALSQNNLAKAIRAGLVNNNQVNQCIGVRGFVTEVDQAVIPTPVMTNYTLGMYDPADLLIESRSGAKALYLTDAALEDAEYFARRLQLLCMTVERIEYIDCGSTRYIDWFVNGPKEDELGNQLYPGDLPYMLGKYYLDPTTWKLAVIDGSEKHLYNTSIKLRSVLTCQHHDPHAVCEVCFGMLAKNISRHSNLGHVCSATMTKQSSQSVISTKHLDKSSKGTKIVMDSVMSRFFSLTEDGSAVLILPKYKDKDFSIIIPAIDASGLVNVAATENVDNLSPHRITSIKKIDVAICDGEVETFIPMFVNRTDRPANLTMELLKYLKVHRWEVDENNNFRIKFKGWDFSKPIMRVPAIEYSYSEHSDQIAKLIESSMKDLTNRSSTSYTATLEDLFQLVNSKLFVSLSALEVIVYATMVNSKTDLGLARNNPNAVSGVAEAIIKGRSLGGALAYEDTAQTIYSHASVIGKNRPNHPLDVFFCPKEVVADTTRRQRW